MDIHFVLTMLYENLSNVQGRLLGQVANVLNTMFFLEFAINSCGCVIALFLGLRHGLTFLSHDVR